MGLFDSLRSRIDGNRQQALSSKDSSYNDTPVVSSTPDLGINQDAANADSATLLAQLKDIAEDPTDYQVSFGAMCYCPAFIERKRTSCKCALCGSEIGNFEVDDYTGLVKQSGQVKKTGLAEVKIVCIDCLVQMCQSGDYFYDIEDWDVYPSMMANYERYGNGAPIDGNGLMEWTRDYQKYLRERPQAQVDDEVDFYDEEDNEYKEPAYIAFIFKAPDSDKPRLTVPHKGELEYFLAFIQNRRILKTWNDGTILLRDNLDIIERLTGLKL